MKIKPLEQMIHGIERLVKLNDPKKALKLGKFLIRAGEDFKRTVELSPVHRETYSKLMAAVDKAVGVLSNSLQNLRAGDSLKADWARFARLDLLKLKDEVLALREFLLANLDSFRPRRSEAELELEELIGELKNSGAIDERICSSLQAYLSRHPEDLRNSSVAERLARIRNSLREFKRVRRLSHELKG